MPLASAKLAESTGTVCQFPIWPPVSASALHELLKCVAFELAYAFAGQPRFSPTSRKVMGL